MFTRMICIDIDLNNRTFGTKGIYAGDFHVGIYAECQREIIHPMFKSPATLFDAIKKQYPELPTSRPYSFFVWKNGKADRLHQFGHGCGNWNQKFAQLEEDQTVLSIQWAVQVSNNSNSNSIATPNVSNVKDNTDISDLAGLLTCDGTAADDKKITKGKDNINNRIETPNIGVNNNMNVSDFNGVLLCDGVAADDKKSTKVIVSTDLQSNIGVKNNMNVSDFTGVLLCDGVAADDKKSVKVKDNMDVSDFVGLGPCVGITPNVIVSNDLQSNMDVSDFAGLGPCDGITADEKKIDNSMFVQRLVNAKYIGIITVMSFDATTEEIEQEVILAQDARADYLPIKEYIENHSSFHASKNMVVTYICIYCKNWPTIQCLNISSEGCVTSVNNQALVRHYKHQHQVCYQFFMYVILYISFYI